MAKKSKKATTNTTNLPALKIGSRVRCLDDGVEGRVVWANGLMVKIEWTDGEKVTWRRDSLATKPIVILDGDDEQATAPASAVETSAAATESDQPAPAAEAASATGDTDQHATTTAPIVPETLTTNVPVQPESEATTAPAEPATTAPAAIDLQAPNSEPTASEPTAAAPEVLVEQTAPSTPDVTAATAAKPKRQRKATAEPKEKKVSALDAAAKVLAEEGRPMTCKEMIAAMTTKKYWTSPGGKTPEATLYSAILREIGTKGTDARFTKSERGKFARTTVA